MNSDEISNEQIAIAANNLLNIFNDIRKECKIVPVQSGPVYLAEAAHLCSIGTNASEVNEILTQQRNKDMLMTPDPLEKVMRLGIILAIVMGIPAGIYILVTQL